MRYFGKPFPAWAYVYGRFRGEYNMSDFVGLDVSGIKELDAKLKKLVPAAQDAVVDDVSKYYINVFQTEQPSKNFVTRASAYPDAFAKSPSGKMIQGFFNWAQFKKVMALWSEGKVPHHRTQALRRGWRQVGEGVRSFIVNDTPGAQYVVDDDKQSRHERAVGWFRVGELANKRIDRALKVADASVRRVIRKLGLD